MALLLSSFLPWAVMPLLMVGGLFLCFEGAEKILHHGDEADDQVAHEAAAMLASPDNEQALLELEKEKIQGAIRTDFVLSAEIMIITLGTVATASFMTRLSVMSLIAVLMTVGVYGIVAAIVKLDDIGLYLQRQSGKQRDLRYFIGTALLKFAPLLMRFLAVAGTIAMFTVGGGILEHGIPPVHHLTESARNGLLSSHIIHYSE
jgi:predicted DNA repair protein MutK